MMTATRSLKVSTPSDREIEMTRVFDAPRHLVFEAYTKPELLKRWLGAMAGWTRAVCEVDLQVGGTYRYLSRGPGGAEMGMRGTFREVKPPERLVSTEKFDQAWYEGECVGTVTFTEHKGRTTLTLRLLYDSKAVRDGVLRSPAKDGVAAGFDLLDQVLAA